MSVTGADVILLLTSAACCCSTNSKPSDPSALSICDSDPAQLPLCIFHSFPNLTAGHGPAADYWALGGLLFFLLTGTVPFSTPADASHGHFEWPAGTQPSAEACDLLQQLLSPDPALRVGTEDGDASTVKSHAFFKVSRPLPVFIRLHGRPCALRWCIFRAAQTAMNPH